MNNNRLNVTDEVKVEIAGTDGQNLYSITETGFHNVEQAIASAYAHFTGTEHGIVHPTHASESLESQPSFFHYYRNPDSADNVIENFVFTVSNLTTGTSARYRVNAGGHVRILAEVR